MPSLRNKYKVAEMMPQNPFLSLPIACVYMDMSVPTFKDMAAANRISMSVIKGKSYYKKADLDEVILENLIVIRN